MTDTKTLAAELRQFNRWRRGDESLSQPEPYKIGVMLDQAAARLEELERELADLREQIAILRSDEKRLVEFAKTYRIRAELVEAKLEQERQDARAELAETANDYLCLAELLDGHDATECRDNLVKMKADLASKDAHADEIYKAAVDLVAKLEGDLEKERALADRLAHWLSAIQLDECVPDAWEPLVNKSLAAWKESRAKP